MPGPALQSTRSPYELLVAVMLSAQCTDERVNKVTEVLFREHDTPRDDARPLAGGARNTTSSRAGSITTRRRTSSPPRGISWSASAARCPPRAKSSKRSRAWAGRRPTSSTRSPSGATPSRWIRTSSASRNRLGLAPGKTPFEVEKGLMAGSFPKKFGRSAHHWLIWHGRKVCHSQRPACDACTLAPVLPLFRKDEGRL